MDDRNVKVSRTEETARGIGTVCGSNWSVDLGVHMKQSGFCQTFRRAHEAVRKLSVSSRAPKK